MTDVASSPADPLEALPKFARVDVGLEGFCDVGRVEAARREGAAEVAMDSQTGTSRGGPVRTLQSQVEA